jgi:hypothetical protein
LLCIAAVFSSAEANRPTRSHCTIGNPRVAYGAFLGLVHCGFESGIEPLCYDTDDRGRCAIDHYRRLAAALYYLHDAEELRFGDAEAIDPKVSVPFTTAQMTTIFFGDRAILREPGRPDVPMIQVDNGWRVDMTALAQTGGFTPQDEAGLEAETARIDATTRLILTGQTQALHSFAPGDDN